MRYTENQPHLRIIQFLVLEKIKYCIREENNCIYGYGNTKYWSNKKIHNYIERWALGAHV